MKVKAIILSEPIDLQTFQTIFQNILLSTLKKVELPNTPYFLYYFKEKQTAYILKKIGEIILEEEGQNEKKDNML